MRIITMLVNQTFPNRDCLSCLRIWSDGENEVLLDDDSSGSQYFTDDEDSNGK